MPFRSDNFFLYIPVIVCILIFYAIMQKIRAHIETKRQQQQFLWEQIKLEELEKKKASEAEAKRYSNALITLDNPFLLNLTNKSRIILVAGEPGNGKSLTMNMLGKWLYDRQQWLDKKRYKYNLYMRPEYLREQQRLLDGLRVIQFYNVLKQTFLCIV